MALKIYTIFMMSILLVFHNNLNFQSTLQSAPNKPLESLCLADIFFNKKKKILIGVQGVLQPLHQYQTKLNIIKKKTTHLL
jgi:hypothetical protein